jgi:hypothetical protein
MDKVELRAASIQRYARCRGSLGQTPSLGLLQELASPALPADVPACGGLALIRPPIRGGQGDQQQGEDHEDPHRLFVFLRGMAQLLRLLTRLATTVLNQTAIIVVIKRLQRRVLGGMSQKDSFPPGP